MALSSEQIDDLVIAVRNNSNPPRWQDLTQEVQHLTAMPMILQEQRVEMGGGSYIERPLQVTKSQAARNVGLFETLTTNVNDLLTTCKAPWRHVNNSYAVEDRELELIQGKEQVVNHILVRKHSCKMRIAELMEDNMWGKPTSSSDNTTPWGIYQYNVKSATIPTGGFTGGNPSGFSDCASVDSSTYTNYKNWSFNYTNVTKEDLIKYWRKAYVMTDFKSPFTYEQLQKANDYAFYLNYATMSSIEDTAEQQNDNLGRDIASMDGRTLFRNIPLQWVPKLDSDTSNPIYGINWATWIIGFLTGEFMHEGNPMRSPQQPRTAIVHIDNSMNTLCFNRRGNFVGYVA